MYTNYIIPDKTGDMTMVVKQFYKKVYTELDKRHNMS